MQKDNTTPYYFISRVIYPSLKRITRGEVKSESLTNRLASFLPSIGNLEINKDMLLGKMKNKF